MRILFVLFLAIALAAASAPAAGAREISFGAKAGLAVSSITETPEEWEESKEYKAGLAGGLFLDYGFTPTFSLRPELLYISKGVKSNLYDGFITVDVTASFDYIELPVLACYKMLPGRAFRPCVFAGPSVAYSIASELEISAGILEAGVDFSSMTHVSDFGLVAGAGFEYDFGGGTLTFDARFQRGFTNVLMTGDFEINGSTQTISGDDFKNYGFAFMAGYVF